MNNFETPFVFHLYDFITIKTEREEYVLSQQGKEISIADISIQFQVNNEHEDIYLSAQTSALEWIKIRWNKPLPKQVRILGDAWERGYGNFRWEALSGRKFMPWYFLASLKNMQWGFGVRVRPSAMCHWQADTKGISLILDVRSGGNGVLLNGRKLKAAELVWSKEEGPDSFQFAREFCKRMCSNPLLPDMPVYGSNNWYYAYGNSSEQEILHDADYLLTLTEGAQNPPYMVIDDGWQEHHKLGQYNGGPWRKGNSKFPDMKKLAEKIQQKGVHPGIWIRLLQNEDSLIKEEWRLPLNGCLDPSHPEVLEYISQDVERICQWGYDLIKHDFSTYDLFGRWGFEMNPFVTEAGWNFYDRTLTSAEIVKNLYQTIYNACKKYGVIIIGCNTIGHLGAGLMHVNRTGDDTSGLTWERTRIMGINSLAFRLPQHRTFYDIDADCVGITGNIPWKLNKQWADVLAESGTPLFLSVKPGILNEQNLSELNQIMKKASCQTCHKEPEDWQDTDCPEIWSDGNTRLEYNWYEETGLDIQSNDQKYYVQIPLS